MPQNRDEEPHRDQKSSNRENCGALDARRSRRDKDLPEPPRGEHGDQAQLEGRRRTHGELHGALSTTQGQQRTQIPD